MIDALFWASLGLATGTLFALVGCGNDVVSGRLQVPIVDDAATPLVQISDAMTIADAHGADATVRLDAVVIDVGFQDAAPPASQCGDRRCDPDERCDTCEQDCGSCQWPPQQTTEEDAMVALINAQRAQGATCGRRTFGAAPPVVMNEHLRQAARDHSQDMADNNYFDHRSQDGRSPWDRIGDTDYAGRGVGENIAAGNDDAEATFRQWLNSPGHCANFMNASAEDMGVGYATGPGRYRHYWTQVFGR